MTGRIATDLPDLDVDRLLVVVTGSVSAADVPVWIDWTRTCYPDLQLRIVLTRSAQRFVTPAAVAGRLGAAVEFDEWPENAGTAVHVQWQQWAQAIAVYPATFGFIARLSRGMADSPAMLAAQCTSAPLVLAPSLPPGGLESPAFQQHWLELRSRPYVALAPPRRGRSVTTGTDDAWVPAPWLDICELIAQCRREQQGRREQQCRRERQAPPLPSPERAGAGR